MLANFGLRALLRRSEDRRLTGSRISARALAHPSGGCPDLYAEGRLERRPSEMRPGRTLTTRLLLKSL